MMARKPDKRIRVRSKLLHEVDETKLALAVWLMAKGIVEDRTTPDETSSDGKSSPNAPAKDNRTTEGEG